MANRTRPNQILFFVSDDEKRIIKAKIGTFGCLVITMMQFALETM